MLSSKLESLGFSDKEANVYLAMLELGETTIERISRRSKVKRTTAYDIIESLTEKGFVSSTRKSKKKYYFAEDPRVIEQKVEEKKEVIKAILPELLAITNLFDKKPKIRFYEGDEGIKEIFLDSLRYPNQPVWGWMPNEVFSGSIGEFLKFYVPRRIEKRIMSYVIAPDTVEMRRFQGFDSKSLRKMKIDPSTERHIEVEVDIYGNDKVSIMSFTDKIGLVIENHRIYNTIKYLFDTHWNSLS